MTRSTVPKVNLKEGWEVVKSVTQADIDAGLVQTSDLVGDHVRKGNAVLIMPDTTDEGAGEVNVWVQQMVDVPIED